LWLVVAGVLLKVEAVQVRPVVEAVAVVSEQAQLQ